jgi:hypothetical protein
MSRPDSIGFDSFRQIESARVACQANLDLNVTVQTSKHKLATIERYLTIHQYRELFSNSYALKG